MSDRPRSRPDHRLLDRASAATTARAAGREGLDRLRDRAPARVDRRPRRGAAARRSRSTSPTRPRCEAAVGAVEAEPRAPSARSSTTPATASPARSRRCRWSGCARQFETNVFGLVRMCQLVLPGMRAAGRGPDRQRELDGRQARLPGRRRLPRDQVRGRGALRRAALRGRGFGIRRGDHRAGADHDELRRDRRRLARERRRRRTRPRTIPTPSFNAAVGAATVGVYEGPMTRLGGGPDAVAKTIERAITSAQPEAALQGHGLGAAGARRSARCSPTAPGMRSCAASSRAPAASPRRVAARRPGAA